MSDARKESPKDPQAAFYLGVALEGLSDGTGATAAYKDALALDPKLTEASVNLSALLLGRQRPGRRAERGRRRPQNCAKTAGFTAQPRLALEATGKKEESLKATARPSLPRRQHRAAHRLRRAADRRQRRQDRARTAARRVDHDDPKLLEKLSQKFGRLHAFADCIAVLDKAIKASDSANLHVRRAVCRHDQKDDAGARATTKPPSSSTRNSPPAHYYLAKHVCPTTRKKPPRTSNARPSSPAATTSANARRRWPRSQSGEVRLKETRPPHGPVP